jgi:hypothetical protein
VRLNAEVKFPRKTFELIFRNLSHIRSVNTVLLKLSKIGLTYNQWVKINIDNKKNIWKIVCLLGIFILYTVVYTLKIYLKMTKSKANDIGQVFSDDVLKSGQYLYTQEAKYSARLANQRITDETVAVIRKYTEDIMNIKI